MTVTLGDLSTTLLAASDGGLLRLSGRSPTPRSTRRRALRRPPEPVLSILVSIASRMTVEQLSLQAGGDVHAFKMQTLRLLEAVRAGEHAAIREIYDGLDGLDTAALDRDSEIGWKRLSQADIASTVSMALRSV
ncbi:hypothetical protein ACFYT4_09135 [Streptomyces sp. NPDC004609]|uniref:hypothetical protein n=1 Tax=Streptomyces sp. NPDC004609 TaxID=3364704 RepID=UPI00367B22F3